MSGLIYIFFRQYKGLFKFHACEYPSTLRKELAEVIRAGCEIKAASPDAKLVELLAKVEVKLQTESKAKHGCGLLQIYKVIHVSNGISEITGHIVNEMVRGPRLRMGV